jgi:hypothetical protein
LTTLLKADTKFVWGDEQQEVICALKAAIVQNPRLHPLDLTKQFELQTDVLAYVLGDNCSKKLMIGAASQKLTETERNYVV